jgi:hypothetical protein
VLAGEGARGGFAEPTKEHDASQLKRSKVEPRVVKFFHELADILGRRCVASINCSYHSSLNLTGRTYGMSAYYGEHLQRRTQKESSAIAQDFHCRDSKLWSGSLSNDSVTTEMCSAAQIPRLNTCRCGSSGTSDIRRAATGKRAAADVLAKVEAVDWIVIACPGVYRDSPDPRQLEQQRLVVANFTMLQMHEPRLGEVAVQTCELGSMGRQVAKTNPIAPNLKTGHITMVENIESTDTSTTSPRQYVSHHAGDARHVDLTSARRRRRPTDNISVIDYCDFHRFSPLDYGGFSHAFRQLG